MYSEVDCGWPITAMRPSRLMSTPTEIMFVARMTSSASGSGYSDIHPAQMVGDVAGWLAAGQLDPVLYRPACRSRASG